MKNCAAAGFKGELTFFVRFSAVLKGDWTFLGGGGGRDELCCVSRGAGHFFGVLRLY